MANFLHFEGMDLSGKSTAAVNYAAVSPLDWRINRNSLCGDNPIRELADSLRVSERYDAEVVGNVYAAALLADVRSFQRPAENVIQDSTIVLRSLAFHVVNDTPRLADILTDLAAAHPPFDASFYFAASVAARKQRLAQRIREAPETVAPDDLMLLRDPERFVAMERCLVEWSTRLFGSVVIDTSRLTPQQVVRQVTERYNPNLD